jgi:subtilisin family serine protease
VRLSLPRRWITGTTLAALALGCSEPTSDITSPQSTMAPQLGRIPGGKYVAGSYIVVMKQSVGNVDGSVGEMGQRYGLRPHFRYRHALKGFAGRFSPAAVEALRQDPRVAYIEPDGVVQVIEVQTNPPSWGLDRIDQAARPLSGSYTYQETGSGVDAYIIDTGIRTSHSDFGGRAVPGFDAITPGGAAADGHGHGTHVAGTVGGANHGVAKGVHLIAVRVLDNSGFGSVSQVIAGLDWVTEDHTTGPAVANISFGGSPSAAMDEAVERSIGDGVTFAIAAGNSSVNASTGSPARVAQAITVGATSKTDVFASFSNFGAGVDILAPGVDIVSDWLTSNTATQTLSGTSMAAPHVTGAAALYLAAHPAATPDEVESGLVAAASLNKISGVPASTANRLLFSSPGTQSPPARPAAPTLVSPAQGATRVAVPVTLAWNASTGAESYRIQLSQTLDFATLVLNRARVTTTSTLVSGLAPRTVYYWRVRGINAAGGSPWSVKRSFKTK